MRRGAQVSSPQKTQGPVVPSGGGRPSHGAAAWRCASIFMAQDATFYARPTRPRRPERREVSVTEVTGRDARGGRNGVAARGGASRQRGDVTGRTVSDSVLWRHPERGRAAAQCPGSALALPRRGAPAALHLAMAPPSAGPQVPGLPPTAPACGPESQRPPAAHQCMVFAFAPVEPRG